MTPECERTIADLKSDCEGLLTWATNFTDIKKAAKDILMLIEVVEQQAETIRTLEQRCEDLTNHASNVCEWRKPCLEAMKRVEELQNRVKELEDGNR